MEWTPDKIEYFLDGESACRYDRNGTRDVGIWPFDQPFYMILNVAVGGFFGGPVKEEDLPYEMAVDYVRVYQKEATGKA
jgi:beta-glucanase (GH16 family)